MESFTFTVSAFISVHYIFRAPESESFTLTLSITQFIYHFTYILYLPLRLLSLPRTFLLTLFINNPRGRTKNTSQFVKSIVGFITTAQRPNMGLFFRLFSNYAYIIPFSCYLRRKSEKKTTK